MRKFLTICAILLCLSTSAQWQQTGSKVRYVNGIGIPTKDTAAGVAADSSQILIRPADSSLYVKYKRTWMRVGGGGGSIAGSGTTNYVPKFTSSTAIGNSQIFDNGTSVGIGTTSPASKLTVQDIANTYVAHFSGNNQTNGIAIGTDGSNNAIIQGFNRSFSAQNNITLQPTSGNVGIGTTTPSNKVDIFTTNRTALTTVGSGLNVNYNGSTIGQFATIGFSWASSVGNNSTQWGMGMVGTNFASGIAALTFFTSGTEQMRIDGNGNVGIGTASPVSRLDVNKPSQSAGGATPSGALLVSNTAAGNGVLELGTGTGAIGWIQARNSISATYYALSLNPVGSNVLVGTSTDNGVDRLQVSGSMNVSTLATTNNLSVTTNATVGGTLRVTGTTTLGTTNTGAINASSVDAGTGNGSFGNVYSGGIVQMLGVNVKYRNISATYTATTSDDYFINITSGTFTLNLPTAATPYGQVYVIKNSGTGTITVDPNGSQTIDGATTFTMNVQNGSITIIGDGTNWKIVSKYL
ncbi:MAG: hypothetical protein IM591_09140 [Chitinophagaceae bacterium]|nr:hypothetical protein [Chitinophagaceae bacterium]